MDNIAEITIDNFQQEILESNTPVLVDFAAEWCGPCKRLAPVVEEVANDLSGKIKVAHIDIDASQDIASDYNVLSVPTLILFKNGQEADRNVGLISKINLIEFVNKNI